MNNIRTNTLFILLFHCAFLWAQAPNWSVNPGQFSHNMSFTAQVHLDGAEDNGMNNLLAAFVGTELRGVASPQMIGSDAIFYLTVYSNQVSGETVKFKVYRDESELIYAAGETETFQKDANLGSLATPYEINILTNGDWPISLSEIPPQRTLQGYAFAKIPLSDHLVSVDEDPISWTMQSSLLGASLLYPDTLVVTSLDPNWSGTDSVFVQATEVGTANSYSASQYVHFTVLPDYASPDFDYIPTQFIQDNLPLPSGDMDDKLTFSGSCLEYEIQLHLPQGSASAPTWTQPPTNSGSMLLVVDVQYGGRSVNGTSKQLAGFVGGQLAGVTQPVFSNGKWLCFLTLANVNSGEISLRFFDGTNDYLHEKNTGETFVPSGNLGSTNSPYVMELAPMKVDVNATGGWTSTLWESSFMGEQYGWFMVTDCEYPDKKDTTTVLFSVNQCPAQTLNLPSSGSMCIESIAEANEVSWFQDGNAASSGSAISITEAGTYHYEGKNPTACENIIGCPVLIAPGEADTLTQNISNGNLNECDLLFFAPTQLEGTACFALPVELAFFRLHLTEQNRVILNWRSVSEINHAGYEIQRSQNGVNWGAIGFENGNPNSSEVIDYRFTDASPLFGKSYYRLKIWAEDGTHEFSPVRSLELSVEAKPFHFYPNPNNGTFTLNIAENDGQTVMVNLFDLNAKLIWRSTLSEGNWPIGTGIDLPKGQYLLQVIGGNKNWVERVVVR